MNSPLAITITAGTVFMACLHWTYVGASLPSGVGNNNTVVNASDCVCNPVGSLNTTCDSTTADCPCRNGYEGPNCADCQNGYYRHSNQSAECMPCQCDEMGALNNRCDRFATCVCKPGVAGQQCNQCLSGYYRFSASGCKQCNCNQIAIECLYQSKFVRAASHTSMCHNCLLNATWVHECTKLVCPTSEYITADGVCAPCQCSQEQGSVRGTRHCNLTTGKCPKCEGESCPIEDPGHPQYQVYIIASGAVAGVIVITLVILLTVYCRRRCRKRTRLPLWTIELRQDHGGDECDTTQELAFDDLDVMYLDDSYLMEAPTPEYSTDELNGRDGYHTLS